MKRLVLVIGVALALMISAVPAMPAASASTSMPTWTAGDYWVYSLNLSAIIPGFNGAATMRYDVLGTDSLTIGSTTVQTYKTKLNLTASITSGSYSATVTFTGNAWFRTSDLAPAEETFSATIGTTPISFTTTYNPPPAVQWPLTAGQSWNATTSVTSTYNGGSPSTQAEVLNETVQADQSLTVPAGTFTVTPVKQTAYVAGIAGTEYSVSYWSGSAGNYASQKSFYASNNTQVSSMDLKSYSYAAGSSGTGTILGLPVLAWIVIVVIIAVVVVALALLMRRKPAPMVPPPAGAPPVSPPPAGQPPAQPPQTPPGPPPAP